MERLTERVNDRLIMMKQDSGDNASYYWDEGNFKVAEKLATYEDLEEQGLLVRLPEKEKIFKNMSRQEQICETCKENDNGFCNRIGRLVEDDDWCAKWKTKEVPEWKARMMNTFLAGY